MATDQSEPEPGGKKEQRKPYDGRLLSPLEYRAMGLGRHIVDRSNHPNFYASSWPVPTGAETLGRGVWYRLPHLNYNSVLVTVISNHWADGGWHRLQDMLQYTQEQGFMVALEEVDDMSTMPTDAIGIMRACAALLALDSGFEWCFMVDTDVHLEKDTLIRLLAHDRPVVYPLLNILEDKAPGAPISSPRFLRSNLGLQPVVWAAMSCMLFNTKVFNCLDHYAWHGHDYHFAQSLAHYGHRIMVDTDTVVDVTRGPTRNPSKQWDELWSDLKHSHDRRANEDRDRRPPPEFEPAFGHGMVDQHGAYWAADSWKSLRVNGPMQDGKEAGGNGKIPE